jgi:hypothetical protein
LTPPCPSTDRALLSNTSAEEMRIVAVLEAMVMPFLINKINHYMIDGGLESEAFTEPLSLIAVAARRLIYYVLMKRMRRDR